MSQARALSAILCLALITSASAEPVAPLSAQFTEPTNRYPHNVLGDLPGFGALEVELAGGTRLRLVLPESRVFEDLSPRLWDIDGDGIPEIVVVESDQRLGARLTAWTVQQAPDGTRGISLRAAGDFIGTRFRWLAPVGMADFTGNGSPEIAYVTMPHLANRLVLVRLDGDRYSPVAQMDGVSNHRIGEDFVTGGVRDCGAGPVILIPSADWRQVIRATYEDGRLTATARGPFTTVRALEAGLACNK